MTQWVESPPHVDTDRVRHISDDGLLRAVSLPGVPPGIPTLSEWRSHRASADARRPVGDPAEWAARRLSRGAGHPDGVVDAAEELLVREVDFLDGSAGRSRYYGFHYLGWMTPLLEAYAFTGDARYARRFGQLFSEWYDVRDSVRGDWPGLDVVWYSLGVWARLSLCTKAMSVFAGEQSLEDDAWIKMAKTVLGGARWIAEEHDTFRHGNWQLAAVTELAHVAAVFPEFVEREEWLALSRARVDEHLDLDFYRDGGHHERAPSYHAMCVTALQRAALSVRAEEWPLASDPRLRRTYEWMVAMAHPAGWIPPFQDSSVVYPARLLVVGHHLFGVPEWKALALRWLTAEEIADELDRLGPLPDGSTAAEFFWRSHQAPPGVGSEVLESSGYVVFRTGWGPTDLALTINAGPFVGHELEPHSHHASLDFVASGWGAPLAWEAGGPPSYDDPGYYDWFQHPLAHNGVTIGDEHDSVNRDTRILHTALLSAEGRGIDVFRGSHRAFGCEHRRTVIAVWSEPRYWLILDEIDGQQRDSTWSLHSFDAWRSQGRVHATDGLPRLTVVTADDALPRQSSGPARFPGLPAEDGTVRPPLEAYRTIHGLRFDRSANAMATLVLPANGAARATPRLAVEGGQVVIHGDSFTDRVTSESWTRSIDGDVVEQAGFSGFRDAPDALVLTSAVTDWWLGTADGRFDLVVQTDRATAIEIRPPSGGEEIRLQGTRIGRTAPEGGTRMTLPSSGRWTIEASGPGRT